MWWVGSREGYVMMMSHMYLKSKVIHVTKAKSLLQARRPIRPALISGFLLHEVTRNISTPSWMACWSITGLPPAFSPLTIYMPG